MANFVTNTAVITCNQALPPGKNQLVVLPSGMVDANNQPVATIMDFKPTIILPFGMCNTEANPAVAAATSAASGVHTPAPCIPNVVGPWSPGSATVSVGGLKALTKDSKCTCAFTGQISIEVEGGKTASVG